MQLNQAVVSREGVSAAQVVTFSLRTDGQSPVTIRRKKQASNPMEMGCLDYEQILARRLANHVVRVGQQFEQSIGGRKLQLKVASINECDSPEPFLIRRHYTQVTIHEDDQGDNAGPCGGIDELANVISNVIYGSTNKMLPAFQTLNIPIAKTILLHGVSGVGKATLVRQIAKKLKYAKYQYHMRELLALSEQFDEPGFEDFNPLRFTFQRAKANSPSIILIKGLDLLRIDSKVEASTRSTALSLLRKNIKSIQPNEQIFVIGLATGLKKLPEPLKTLDIFDQHEHVPIPTRPQRELILRALIDYYKIGFEGETSESIASRIGQRTSGYVAKDLRMLLRSAVLYAMRKRKPSPDISTAMNALSLSEPQNNGLLMITWNDVEYALEHSAPSQQAGFETTIDKRSWDDIGGYTALKTKLQRAVLLPISNPETYAKLGIPPPSGILLYGPSGCGKSLFVQALASQSTMNVINVKGSSASFRPEIFSKFLGETEGVIRNLFATAKRVSPCIVFIDEMDSIACKRGWDTGEGGNSVNERVLSTLLNEMDGVEGRQGVFVIGCTNRPDQIDDAILRPGRLDLLLHVDLPTKEDRRDIIRQIMSRMSVADDVDIQSLTDETNYCTGADLNNIFREAARNAIKEDKNIDHIHHRHIVLAVERIRKRAECHATDGSLQVFRTFSDRGMQ